MLHCPIAIVMKYLLISATISIFSRFGQCSIEHASIHIAFSDYMCDGFDQDEAYQALHPYKRKTDVSFLRPEV